MAHNVGPLRGFGKNSITKRVQVLRAHDTCPHMLRIIEKKHSSSLGARFLKSFIITSDEI